MKLPIDLIKLIVEYLGDDRELLDLANASNASNVFTKGKSIGLDLVSAFRSVFGIPLKDLADSLCGAHHSYPQSFHQAIGKLSPRFSVKYLFPKSFYSHWLFYLTSPVILQNLLDQYYHDLPKLYEDVEQYRNDEFETALSRTKSIEQIVKGQVSGEEVIPEDVLMKRYPNLVCFNALSSRYNLSTNFIFRHLPPKLTRDRDDSDRSVPSGKHLSIPLLIRFNSNLPIVLIKQSLVELLSHII